LIKFSGTFLGAFLKFPYEIIPSLQSVAHQIRIRPPTNALSDTVRYRPERSEKSGLFFFVVRVQRIKWQIMHFAPHGRLKRLHEGQQVAQKIKKPYFFGQLLGSPYSQSREEVLRF
jgi:hypothetical protein